MLSWGPSASGWILESSPELRDGVLWSPVNTQEITVDLNSRSHLAIPISESSRFLRLRRPQ